jgi:hypothetical protein
MAADWLPYGARFGPGPERTYAVHVLHEQEGYTQDQPGDAALTASVSCVAVAYHSHAAVENGRAYRLWWLSPATLLHYHALKAGTMKEH